VVIDSSSSQSAASKRVDFWPFVAASNTWHSIFDHASQQALHVVFNSNASTTSSYVFLATPSLCVRVGRARQQAHRRAARRRTRS
jgi:hypothetical protein